MQIKRLNWNWHPCVQPASFLLCMEIWGANNTSTCMLTILSNATLYQRFKEQNILACWSSQHVSNYSKGECNAWQDDPNNSLGSTSCTTSRPQSSAHNSPLHQHREQKLREKTRGGRVRGRRGPTWVFTPSPSHRLPSSPPLLHLGHGVVPSTPPPPPLPLGHCCSGHVRKMASLSHYFVILVIE